MSKSLEYAAEFTGSAAMIQHENGNAALKDVVRLGFWSFNGIFLLTLFATMLVRVTVHPTVKWSLHLIATEKMPRAFIGSLLTSAVLALILMGGKLLIDGFHAARSSQRRV